MQDVGCSSRNLEYRWYTNSTSAWELVLSKPFISMPIRIWNDKDYQLLKASYYSMYQTSGIMAIGQLKTRGQSNHSWTLRRNTEQTRGCALAQQRFIIC
ncbi:MAG: hypothetical protein CM15mP83_5900 [Flavobacteriaceae bacterium]|nr:MAG: hypothetical protein CM15mP83_5900 [Flavobacteriaceae bacterium]